MAAAELPDDTLAGKGRPPGPLAEFWHYFSANGGAVAGLVLIALLFLGSILAGFVAPHDPAEQFRDHILSPPVWQAGGSGSFLLGTDAVGRDILSRLVFGARYSLLIGSIVVSLSLCLGVVLGLLAGYAGGIVETIILRLMDILMSIPALLLAIVVVAILGPGLINAMIAVALVSLPGYTRLTRAAVLAEIRRDYVVASQVVGAGHLRLMFMVILPNCAAPLIVQASLGFSDAILNTAALGFLGLGAQPPASEWGTMLADSREFVLRAWWVVTFPGLAILLTVLAFNLLGDGLRDALDPKLKRS
ncbi:dipeptide transport system permease protein [Arboricoccus pini]|uniref:Dipeptide transport system permease protein n=1 Tax=Arboricoccus pini TaxID=1963835 RepID=A0A212QYB6_9PROT|nr:ABC transporter permease subunit [Arboricoccus pini]SNB64727.1 dipeptide transport system permease protein [Arboricoccus pini]